MQLIVITITLLICISAKTYAQTNGSNSIDSYTPPPMFGAPLTGVYEGNQQSNTPGSSLSRSTDMAADGLPSSASQRPVLLDLDSITGRPPPVTRAKQPVTAVPFKPPYPPKRPQQFQVSKEYLDQLKRSDKQQSPEVHSSNNDKTAFSTPPNLTPRQEDGFLVGDALHNDLVHMNVRDVYENIGGLSITEAHDAKVAAAAPAPAQAGITLQTIEMNYEPGRLSLNDSDKNILKQNVIPYLRGTPAGGIELQSFATGPSDRSAKRNSLTRALALRAYLIDHGIELERVTIKPMGAFTSAFPQDVIFLKPL